MPITKELLAGLGCLGSASQLARLVLWLDEQEVSCLSELKAVASFDGLDGEFPHLLPTFLFPLCPLVQASKPCILRDSSSSRNATMAQ